VLLKGNIMSIYHRKLEEKIRPLLHRRKALIIVGARQVGKSTMLQNMDKVFGDALWLNADENSIRDHLSVIDISGIRSLIGNYKMVIIDEIQRVKNAGLMLKMMVDNFKEVQFIATGSSALEISETVFEPLTGRFFLFHLYPFSLAEIYPAKSSFEIEQALPFHLVYGNYPEVCTQRDLSEMIVKNLAQQYLYKDVLVWKDIRRPELLDKLLKLLAFQIGSQVSINELARSLGVKSETVRNYIDLLEKSFVIYQLKSFGTNQRKEVSKMSKVYFWDNGIRNAVIGNFDPLSQRTDTGALFENFIISERLKMLSWSDVDAKGFFWRNYNKSEVDYIEQKRDLIKAFEIKWNTNKQYRVSRAFTNLYPNAETQIVTPSNLVSFVFNE
jgi:predicted AAA+ superfamily ATPase